MSDLLWAGARVHLTEVDPGTGALCGNVGLHVGDDPSLVRERRRSLARRLGRDVVWMDQTHSIRVDLLRMRGGELVNADTDALLGRPARGEWGPSTPTVLSLMPAAARALRPSPYRPPTVCPSSYPRRRDRLSLPCMRVGVVFSEGYSPGRSSACTPLSMVPLTHLSVRRSVGAATRFLQTWRTRVRISCLGFVL